MPSALAGQVAIVTGASSGTGWQTAVRLAEEGARLCVTARRRAALERLREEVEARGAECVVVPGDVTSQEDVDGVVGECLRRFESVDILVNNAAVQAYAYFWDYEWREIERVMDVSFYGYLRFARAVLPHFRARGSGHIVNVLSMLALGAAPLLSSYTAAKHALYGWADSLRLELYDSPIQVSNIMLPSVSTPMFDHAPTRLGRQPRPVPPTYDTDIAAQSVLRVLREPDARYVPVFLQGKLLVWMQHYAPKVGDLVLGRWGVRMQVRDASVDRPEGNLWEPMEEGVGPYGSVPPSPPWMLAAARYAFYAMAGAVGLAALRLLKLVGRLLP